MDEEKSVSLPKIAGDRSIKVELEKGQTYYFCTCGLSEKQPFCDGKHKGTGFKSQGFSSIITGTFGLCLCKHSKKLPYCDGTHREICCVASNNKSNSDTNPA